MRNALTERAVRCRRAVAVLLAGVALGVLGAGAPAVAAPSAGWLVQSTVAPSNIAPGGEGRVTVTVENVGDASVSGAGTPVVLKDALPAGLEVTEIYGFAGSFGAHGPMACDAAQASCSWSEAPLEPYEALVMYLSVKAAASASSGVSEVTVSGGEVPGTAARRPVSVSSNPVAFGVQSYALAAEEEGGLPATRAGSHPFQLTTALALNETAQREHPPALVRNLGFDLPAGLLGNPTRLPQCPTTKYLTTVSVGNACPADTAVGVAYLVLDVLEFELRASAPVFNLAPAHEPARFGFLFAGQSVILDTSLRTGGDYGVTVSSRNTSQLPELVSANVTLWGVPNDPRHDASRGWGCVDSGLFAEELQQTCTPSSASRLQPFLTLPTSCTGPLASSVSVTSWPTRANPEGLAPAPVSSEPIPGMEGCERLPFGPELSVTPEGQAGGSPTGFGVDVHIPQLENPIGLAEGNLKKAVVTLPAGVVVNPAAANGLGACSPGQIGLSNANPASCPDSAKVGTAEAVSPAIKTPLVGSVYVAEQGNNPFGSLLALYLVLEGEGVLVKVAGEVHLDPATGQVTTTFDNVPQQPISDIKLHLFGGPQAALATPIGCGTYTATSQMTPYNALVPVEPSSAFQITSGPNGSGCGAQGFGPSFTAGTTSNQAAGFSPLSVTFSRTDQEQGLGGVTVKTPPGLLGVLKSVPLCGEPQASQGTCGQESLIGHTTVGAGAGPDPVSVGGQVFLTGPYKGAPFGLSIVVPAVVGPFNLGTVVVRAAISVDPVTTALTVSSDPLPTILQGIPLQIRAVNVTVDRPGFIFNPTDCEPLTLSGTVTSTQGAQAQVSSAFHAANCAVLPFHPVLSASSLAKTSRNNGAALDVKVSYPQGVQANIHSVAVTLPRQLPARLSTIQQACPAAIFESNPASCDEGSNIGIGTAYTPIFNNPEIGPAYLVSHGGAAFPDVDVVLQGEGVTILLVGHVNISKAGITSATFFAVPDAPISSFELNLPEGPHSGLSAVGSLCAGPLSMPTTITAQNGAGIQQNTKIKVTGCTATKKKAKKRKKTKKRKKGKKK
jgi:uncharacterized repeat protein (TIGR01451 family)